MSTKRYLQELKGTSVQELFADVPKAVTPGNKDLQILRTAIIAEQDAVNLYQKKICFHASRGIW